MRLTTVLRRLIAVTSIFAQGMEFTPDGLIVDVRPTWRRPRCSQCQRRGAVYDRRPARLWRHLGLGRLKIWLQ